ncbi:MAG TPA: M15 family metallopeptidase [Fibrobacteria bacterium]|nr:M15 family metallopeptidase [Fibrobacteria bacterium]
MPKFVLGAASRKELQGVHADLVRVVHRAIELTAQDFSVHDGIRTLEEQKRLVAAGASKTMESRHITGHAVDLVPYINGKLRWEWEPIYVIADAVRMAAREFQVPIRWGGSWDVAFTDSTDSPEHLVAAYVETCRQQGKRAFIDGPHFELPKARYP